MSGDIDCAGYVSAVGICEWVWFLVKHQLTIHTTSLHHLATQYSTHDLCSLPPRVLTVAVDRVGLQPSEAKHGACVFTAALPALSRTYADGDAPGGSICPPSQAAVMGPLASLPIGEKC